MSKVFTWKRVGIGAAVVFGLGTLFSGALLADAWVPFGKAPEGERLAKMEASPQRGDGIFVNPQPLWNDMVGGLTTMFSPSDYASPDTELPVKKGDRARFASPPESGLRITWLGHSTQLIEIGGATLITDPIFGGRASPFDWAGPEVWYGPPIPFEELPPIDAVLISHDHYDHLQMETMVAMADWDTTFIVPLGVGAHLEYWGVPAEKVTEVDWWDTVKIKDIEVVATPARHASGRHLLDQNNTLWAGYAMISDTHRVFFSGDTGLFPAMSEIGERFGPFDVTMVEVGAYDQAWPDWHIGPEQALRAHDMLRGKLFIPVHWGLWNLASHGWTEPVERVLAVAKQRDAKIYVPRPGESLEPAALPPMEKWWPDRPWRTAEEYPIKSRLVDPE